MKTKTAKLLVSLLLIAVIAVSGVIPATAATTAATNKFKYSLDFYTAGSDGTSVDCIFIQVHGENGSTDWHDISSVGGFRRELWVEIYDTKDVGKVTGVSVKNEKVDGWYPERIVVTSPSNKATTIHCGAWVNNRVEVRFDVTDNVFAINIKTSNALFSGTNSDVYAILYDQNGVATKPFEMSTIYPYVDAFERGDDATMIVAVPDNFDKLSSMKLYLDVADDTFAIEAPEWRVQSVKLTQISGAHKGDEYYKALNKVCTADNVITIQF